MSRNTEQLRLGRLFGASWAGAAAGLAIAVGTGTALAAILISPPAEDIQTLLLAFSLAGSASLSLGWLVLRLADRVFPLTIRNKLFVGAAIGSAVGGLNVLAIARLMFISADHDLQLLVVTMVFSAVVTLLFSNWVATRVADRVDAIGDGLRALAAGDYRARVEVVGGDEVSELATLVNDLAARLASASDARAAMDRERRELTAAVSHDLRTPLASVRAMVEALDDRVVDDPTEVERYYSAIRREIERLNRMIDDLFELAKLDAGAVSLDRTPLTMQEIAAEVVDSMEPQAREAGIVIELVVEGTPPILLLDGNRIERALANLLRNAIEYTSSPGSILVAIRKREQIVELEVTDSGEGIAEADLSHIWERFYRAERSRKRGPRSANGAGLGLAIVRGIVEAHGGDVSVFSKPGQGATFCVHLPVHGEAAVRG